MDDLLSRISTVLKRQDFRMCVPPESDDTDVVLEECRDAIESLRQQLAALAQGVKVQIPTETMEQEFALHYRKGYERGFSLAKQEFSEAEMDLREQLADVEESNKAVEKALDDVDYRGTYADGVLYLKQQLAAALAACEEKNRGLDKLARLGNEPYLGNSVGNRIAAEFLAIKPDASILKQHDAELIERCADKLAICLAKDEPWEPAIRELKAEL